MPEGMGYPEEAMPAGQAPAGPADPEAVMQADQAVASEQFQMVAQTAPAPEKPFSKKAISTLVSQFNDTISAMSGGQLPAVEVTLEGEGQKWSQPLPPQIFVPMTALYEAVKVGAPDMAEKYTPADPTQILDDTGLRKASASLRMMEKDKKLIKAMQAPGPESAPGMNEAPEGDMPEGDEPQAEDSEAMLKENMA